MERTACSGWRQAVWYIRVNAMSRIARRRTAQMGYSLNVLQIGGRRAGSHAQWAAASAELCSDARFCRTRPHAEALRWWGCASRARRRQLSRLSRERCAA
eukprot:2154825-Pleurochrysis_carterae.AAC.3